MLEALASSDVAMLDRDDIRERVDSGFVEHATLDARPKDEIERYPFDARTDRLPLMIAIVGASSACGSVAEPHGA